MHGNNHSFVVRIWHEALDGEGNATIWRGWIHHVPSGQKQLVDDLDQVVHFIQEQAGLGERCSSSPSNATADTGGM